MAAGEPHSPPGETSVALLLWEYEGRGIKPAFCFNLNTDTHSRGVWGACHSVNVEVGGQTVRAGSLALPPSHGD